MMLAYAKRLDIPVALLESLGAYVISGSLRRVAIPHRDGLGAESVSLSGATSESLAWRSGDRPMAFGLDRVLQDEPTHVVVARSLSESLVLLAAGQLTVWFPKTTSPAEILRQLCGVARVSVLVKKLVGPEADGWTRLADGDRLQLVKVPRCEFGRPAISSGHSQLTIERLGRGHSAEDLAGRRDLALREEADQRSREIRASEDVLALFEREIGATVAGNPTRAKLLFLVLTTHLLANPVSVIVKGASSSGKSHLVGEVLKFFPDDAHLALTAMSERAILYFEEPLSHRHLVLYEEGGTSGEFIELALRTLLSEGAIRYRTVVKEDGVNVGKEIFVPGPTGLITTTTKLSIHPENETRMLSITVPDSPEDSRAVYQAHAEELVPTADFEVWHAFQHWLGLGAIDVRIPFAAALGQLFPTSPVRLRRDFVKVLSLIKGHALLHRERRQVDPDGRIQADLTDYSAVRRLLNPVLRETIGALTTREVRETVTAVTHAAQASVGGFCTVMDVARQLDIHKSNASRRVTIALDAGFIGDNNEGLRTSRKALYVIERPGTDSKVMPTTRQVAARVRMLAREHRG
jgi:hypothetical protein